MVKSTSNQPQQGTSPDEAPALLRDLFKIQGPSFGIDAVMPNLKLHLVSFYLEKVELVGLHN
jgi:hypothetical protein